MAEAHGIVDHSHDVIIVGAGEACLGAAAGIADRGCEWLASQTCSDAQQYGRRAGGTTAPRSKRSAIGRIESHGSDARVLISAKN
ncbi:hypothetical protein [Mesorhizobium sp. CN2-181]|uniref:hypothetical protein n=1 Tax=Mesorhizobium yinganensis TaxID=3157707 RepID=UPI0032B72B49